MRARLAAVALASALGSGCRRPAQETAATANLTPPAPSSTTIASPLAASASGYTNEMQARYLQDQTSALGIRQMGKASDLDPEPRPVITYQEGVARMRAAAREFAEERRALEARKGETAVLGGDTPQLTTPSQKGGPVEGK